MRGLCQIAYLFSKYPVVSQTFCDTEILALERHGLNLVIGSVSPPSSSFRHGHAASIRAPVEYVPHEEVRKLMLPELEKHPDWPVEMIARHEAAFGAGVNARWRAANAFQFVRVFREYGVGHVHVHFARQAAVTALYLKKIAGFPFSITAHAQDFIVDTPRELLIELCEEAAFVVCVSEYSLEVLRGMAPSCAEKMHRVYNGIDLSRFPRSRRSVTPVPRILSIGRLVEFKGFHYLLRALGQLRRRGVLFECDIIGEGPWKEHLANIIREEQLDESVELCGMHSQEEVSKALADCDIFALACTTDPEGASDILPTVILEAMASAKPVVSTRMAGIPEMVEHGKTGLLLEPGDGNAFAEALFAMLSDHELRHEMGNAGRLLLENRFAATNTSAEMKALFARHVPSAVEIAKPDVHRAVLLEAWPGLTADWFRSDLEKASESGANWPVFVCRIALPIDRKSDRLPACNVHFLPDAIVLEANWKHSEFDTRAIEELRDELSSNFPCEQFLYHAREAAWLASTLARNRCRTIHALGETAAAVAWILHRISGIGYTVTIPAPFTFPGKDLSRMLADAAGGWLGGAVDGLPEARFFVVPEMTTQDGQTPHRTRWLGSLLGKVSAQQKPAATESVCPPLGSVEWQTQVDNWHERWTDAAPQIG